MSDNNSETGPSIDPATDAATVSDNANTGDITNAAAAGTTNATTPASTETIGSLAEEGVEGYSIIAEGLSLSAEEGKVYGPLDFRIPNRGVTILSGTGGSGRTALALTLSGRMKPDEGHLEVLGYTKRKDIRNRVAIAGVEQVDLLDRDVTVRTLLTEHLNWSRKWWYLARTADEEYLETVASDVFGPRSLPPLDAYVAALSGLDRHLLRMALALHPANGHDIEMLIVDDLEQIHEIRAQQFLLRRVHALSKDIPVVVNAVNPIPDDVIPIAAVVKLDTDKAHIQPEESGLRARIAHTHLAAEKILAPSHSTSKSKRPRHTKEAQQ